MKRIWPFCPGAPGLAPGPGRAGCPKRQHPARTRDAGCSQRIPGSGPGPARFLPLERGLSSRRRCLPSYFATPIGHGLLGKACRGTHRAQLTFSSWNKVKALGKLDATNLAQVHHSIVRARGEPLERSVVPCSSVDGFSSKPRAQLTFSSWNKVKAWQA